MALYRISSQPLQLIQPAHPAALLVNVGNEICYLDTVSTVSDRSYSLRLDPGQSVNFGGNANLWAVCSLGLSTEISLLKDSNTTITPIRNVKIDGDVSLSGPVQIDGTVQVAGSVDIGGGTVNVGTISGDVSVDGSTVNIGNNVRLWGGGDYLGYYDFVAPMGTMGIEFLGSMFPALITGKYYSMVLEVIHLSGATGVWNVTVGNFDITNMVTLAYASICNPTSPQVAPLASTASVKLHVPILGNMASTSPSSVLTIANARMVNLTFRVRCWGSYTEINAPRIIPPYSAGTPIDAGTLSISYIPSWTASSYYPLPCHTDPYTLYMIAAGGAIGGPIQLARLVPDVNGYSVIIMKQLAPSLAASTVLEIKVDPSPYINCIIIAANARNTLTSVRFTQSQR